MNSISRAAELQSFPERIGMAKQHEYSFDGRSALLAAAVAALAITAYMLIVPRALGIEQMDIGITVGAMVGPEGSLAATMTRVAWHVGNGLVYVFAYAAILAYWQKQSTLLTGVAFGVVLWAAGPMTTIPMALDLHPLVQSGRLVNPGIFMQSLGLGWEPAAVDLGAHLVHGILTGVVYKHRSRS